MLPCIDGGFVVLIVLLHAAGQEEMKNSQWPSLATMLLIDLLILSAD